MLPESASEFPPWGILLPEDDRLLKLKLFSLEFAVGQRKGAGVFSRLCLRDKDTFLIYILEECGSLFMHLLMVVFDLFPAVQLHTEPEYKDETMTVYQIPLTGEHWCCRETGEARAQ